MAEYKFEGWLGLDADSANGKLVWGEFEPKPWEETDVDIKVSHCGICGSDLHTLRSGWVGTITWFRVRVVNLWLTIDLLSIGSDYVPRLRWS